MTSDNDCRSVVVNFCDALLAKPCKWSGRQFLSSSVFTFCGCEKSQETTPFTGCNVATCTFLFTILGLGDVFIIENMIVESSVFVTDFGMIRCSSPQKLSIGCIQPSDFPSKSPLISPLTNISVCADTCTVSAMWTLALLTLFSRNNCTFRLEEQSVPLLVSVTKPFSDRKSSPIIPERPSNSATITELLNNCPPK